MSNNKISTNKLIKISLLSAIAVVIMYFEFPILPAFDWLKIDFSDIPALIGAFAYGPITGVVIEALKLALRFFLKGTQTGGIGELANFIIGAAFMIPAGLIYSRNKTRKNAIIAMITASIIMTVAGALANLYLLIPLYKNFLPALKEQAYVVNYLMYGVIPFNLIKGVAVSAITLIIYKKVSVLIIRESVSNKNRNAA